MSVERFAPPDLLDLYEVYEWRNGLAVLAAACPEEWDDILQVLQDFRLHHTEIATPGGRKSLIADRIDSAAGRKWVDECNGVRRIDVLRQRWASGECSGRSSTAGDEMTSIHWRSPWRCFCNRRFGRPCYCSREYRRR